MKRSWFIYLTSIVGLMAGLAILSQSLVLGMAARPPIVGSPAPDFQLNDLNGQAQSLQQYRGKIVLLNFWATWCKPCTKEMPAMQAAFDELRNQGLVVVAINELEDVKRVRDHIHAHHHTFHVLIDEDNQVANRYGVVGLPVTVFIDETGHIQKYVKGGLLTKELIHKTVDQILAAAQTSEIDQSKT